MSKTTRFFGKTLMMAALAVALMAVLVLGPGCGKHHPDSHAQAAQASSGGGCCAPGEQMATGGQASVYTRNDNDASAAELTTGREQEPTSAEQPLATAAVAEQTTCPVMGGTINKALFVEHQGKKVYFCCGGCPEMFKADPAKYVAKLPQF